VKTAPIPADEDQRLQAVHGLGILDTPAEERFDCITRRAVKSLRVPISTISIIDRDREWFKSCHGTDRRQGSRDVSFCGHAMLERKMLVIEDATKDPRFADNPAVVGPPFIRFYAGVALYDRRTKQPIGVFCVKDTHPRTLSTEEVGLLLELAEEATFEMGRPVSQT
jgi:GAF domain-containing protein